MKTKLSMMFLLLVLLTSGCGLLRYPVIGRVVDAETGKPIEGAAVGIHWYDYSGRSCLAPPFASGYTGIETASDLTDADGVFRIPDRPMKKYKMGVYKKGYVCWSSETIFHPEFYDRWWNAGGKPDEAGKVYESRIWSWVGPGMVIRLKPWKEGYSAEGHAEFVTSINRDVVGARHFSEAIREEQLLLVPGQVKRREQMNRQIEEMRRQDELKKKQGGDRQ